MKTPISPIPCSFFLFAFWHRVFGCPCTDDCNLPTENKCPVGLNPLCEQNGDVCGCTCTSAASSEKKDKLGLVDDFFSLSIQIDSAAGGLLAETGKDLTIFKGYTTVGQEFFNAAWHVVENSALLPGQIDFGWSPFIKAAFVSDPEDGVQSYNNISDEFEGGHSIAFGIGGWGPPSRSSLVDPPYFEVQYSLSYPMYLVLLAPIINENHEEEWSPFFYDDIAMTINTPSTIGSLTTSLYASITSDVEEGTYSTLPATVTKIEYGDALAMNICICTSSNSTLIIALGACTEADSTKMETA